jgi:outer membrane protein assembly factor BamB
VKSLAASWPEGGPRRLWSRALGDGYSSIVADDKRIYTMYRRGEREVVIAMEAATGVTAWEYSYDAPFTKDYDMSNGPGPHATPLLAENYIFTTGATSKLHCLDKQTGRVVWSRDLIKEFNGTVRVNGYSCSPLAYKNSVIVMVGGAGSAIVALNQKDGSVVWKKHDSLIPRPANCSGAILIRPISDSTQALPCGATIICFSSQAGITAAAA